MIMIKDTQTRRRQVISGAGSPKRRMGMAGRGRGDGIRQVRIFFDSRGEKSCALDRTKIREEGGSWLGRGDFRKSKKSKNRKKCSNLFGTKRIDARKGRATPVDFSSEAWGRV